MKDQSFGSKFDLVCRIVGVTVIIVGVYLVYTQYRKDHEEKKRYTTHQPSSSVSYTPPSYSPPSYSPPPPTHQQPRQQPQQHTYQKVQPFTSHQSMGWEIKQEHIPCPRCDGVGYVRLVCLYCRGSGYIYDVCRRCLGYAYAFGESSYDWLGGHGWARDILGYGLSGGISQQGYRFRYEKCPECDGVGRSRYPCPYCGAGKIITTCPVCKGNKFITRYYR